MAKTTRICKICGKEYEYCKTPYREGVYRWQDNACCEEHGLEYLEKILASRSAKTEPAEEKEAVAVAPVAIEEEKVIKKTRARKAKVTEDTVVE